MSEEKIAIGQEGSAKLTVAFQHTAKAIALDENDDFPEVYATSSMIALMELAAARIIQPLLKEGQLSVGVGLDIKHLAATPVGVEVEAKAVFQGMEGKIFRFTVEATDPGGLIGKGEHTRAIIDTERLLQGAQSKLK